jgi:hypothetical protein
VPIKLEEPIFCAGGAARVGVRRETYDDLLAREVEVY